MVWTKKLQHVGRIQELAQSNDLPLPVPVPTRMHYCTQYILSLYRGLQEFHANFRGASFYEALG